MIVVAGHVCLDIIPHFTQPAALDPGTLVRVGPAAMSTGGVSNAGVALHRLGVPTRLIHKVGDDLFGDAVKSILAKLNPQLTSGITTVPGETTSYSVVISPPDVDRMFIHCPGANDTFGLDDVPAEALKGATYFHFGYPPIMRTIYSDGGETCRRILERARAAGHRTSLDLCSVDTTTDAGKVDWQAWLQKVLPAVDLFTPSYDELALMLGRSATVSREGAIGLARQCRIWGSGAVLLKLGNRGLVYEDAKCELHQPCRKVNVVGTNGSGDCTIAGFLAAMHRGDPIERAMELATAVGACCCETADATSGVPALTKVEERLSRGWPELDKGF